MDKFTCVWPQLQILDLIGVTPIPIVVDQSEPDRHACVAWTLGVSQRIGGKYSPDFGLRLIIVSY